MRKNPMKISELFDTVKQILTNEGKMPADIDYAIPCSCSSDDRMIKNTEWDVIAHTAYGGSEGIYLDLAIRGDIGDGNIGTFDMGTVKTLSTTDEAMYAMARLGADFYLSTHKYVTENTRDFEWEGTVLTIDAGKGMRKFGMYFSSVEQAVEAFHEEFLKPWQTYPHRGVILDLEKRREIEILPGPQDIKNLWMTFGDVPMDPGTECLEAPFLHFPAGTFREDIWKWFEEEFSISVHDLMYGE